MAQSHDDENPEEKIKRRNWVGAIGSDARSFSHTAFARAGFPDPSLVLRWEEIAGPETARLAVPVKFREGPFGGTLTLKAEPGAALFLQHETRELTERINAYLGRPLVAKLRFVQGPVMTRPRPAPRPTRPDAVPADDPANRYNGPESVRSARLALARARQR